MTELDALLADPVDHELRRGRSLPPVLFGVMLPARTACGLVSRSASQTAWAVSDARRLACRAEPLRSLLDSDLLWLLLMGWEPRASRPGPNRGHRLSA